MNIQHIKRILPTYLINFVLLIFSILFLLQPAIYNHYPLCHPDLWSYLASGFENTTHQFRPLLYGVLIRHISMGYSLWFVVVFQALMFSISIFLLFNYVFRLASPMFKTFLTAAILSSFTTTAFYVCHLIPDIYSGLGIIAVVILFNKHKNHWLLTVYAVIVLMVAGLVHYSNIGAFTVVILLLVILAFVFIKNKRNPYTFKKLIIPVITILSLWFFMPLLNQISGGPNRITSNNEVIHMSRLIETGIASEYLHDNCEYNNYDLCNYLDYVDQCPHPSAFVWNYDESPIYKGDCMITASCWEEKAKEYKIIINDMLKKSKYRNMIIWRIGIRGTVEQFFTFGHQPLQRQGNSAPGFIGVQKYFPNELKQFNKAIQQKQEWSFFQERNLINKWTVILSTLIVFGFLMFKPLRKSINASVWVFLIISLIYLTVNAATCSLFSTVSPRYQDRIVWLVALSALILIFNFLKFKKPDQNATKFYNSSSSPCL